MAYQPKSYRKFVAGSVTAAVVASAVAPVASAATPTFSDVPANHQFAEAINALAADGTFIGQGGKFDIYGDVTRRQAAVVFSRLIEGEGKMEQVFSDVPTTDGELTKAAYEVNEAKVMTGANGKLMPYSKLTRQQMAKIIVEYFDFKPVEGSTVKIKDLDKADASLRDYIQILAENGITQVADGNFRPTDNVSRGQFAAFIYRAQQAHAGELAITSVTALDDTNKYLQIEFNKAVSDLDPSDISIRDSKSGDKFGVQEVKLSANGKTAQLTLFENTENDFVLKENVEYTVTVNVNGQVLTSTFYDAAFTEARVVDINVGDREFTAVDDKTGASVKVKVPTDVTFDFEQAYGELVRVWYNDEKELLKSEIVKASAKYDGIEITDTDEIKLLSEDKKYDVSDEKFTKNTAKNKLAFYVDGKEVDLVDGELPVSYKGKKYNFAKVGFNKSGDVEYISVYNLKDFLVVDSVDGNEIIGVEGDQTGGQFNAKDATIVKDGKVISKDEVKAGDLLFYSDSADGDDGFAVVYNKTVKGEIDKVYSDSIQVAGKAYRFLYDGKNETDAFNFNYAQAVFLDSNGELANVTVDDAEDLQAGGEVTVYLDPAGNVVYISGENGNAASNKQLAVVTDKIELDATTSGTKVTADFEVKLEDGKEKLYSVQLDQLNNIYIGGEKRKIDSDPSTDEWKPAIKDGKLYLVSGGSKADILIPTGDKQVVEFKFDEDGKVTEIEFFTNTTATSVGLKSTDTYLKGSKLLSSTVVFNAKNADADFDAEDITTTTWGEYKGSDISDLIYTVNDKNEVESIIILDTTSDDNTYEEAVVTNVLADKEDKVVSIDAWINGKLVQGLAVDKVDVTINKGDAVVLKFDDGNTDLVTDIYTETVLETKTDNPVYDPKYIITGTVDDYSAGSKTVTIDGKQFRLSDNYAVLNATNKSDITKKALSDAKGKKVTIVLDEQNSDYVKFIVIGGTGSGTYDTTAPTVTGVANGTTYNVNVTPTFTEGTATLSKDGATATAYTSGTAITTDGDYVLKVTDAAGNTTTVNFTIDKTPIAGATVTGTYKSNDATKIEAGETLIFTFDDVVATSDIAALEAQFASVFTPGTGTEGFTVASTTTGGKTVATVTAESSFVASDIATFNTNGTITLTAANLTDDAGNTPASDVTVNFK